MKTTLILLMIFSAKLDAQHYDPGLISIFENLPTITGPQYTCHQFTKIHLPYAETRNRKDLQNCATALCGPSRDNPTALITDMNFSNYATPLAQEKMKKLGPLIKNVIEKERADKIEQLKTLKNSLNSKAIDEIDFSKLNTHTKSDFFSKIYNSIIEIRIKPENPVDKRLTLDYNFPSWANDNFKQVGVEFAESYKRLFENRFDSFKGHGIFTDQEIRTKLENEIKEADELLEKNPNLQYADRYRKDIDAVKDRLSKNQPITYRDFDATSFVEYSKKITIKNPGSYSACTTPACEMALKDYFKNEATAEKIEEQITKALDSDQIEREANKCQAGLMANYIKAGNQKMANSQFKEAMEAIKKNVLPLFSSHSRAILQKSLDQLRINVSKPSDMALTSEAQFINDSNSYLKDKKTSNITADSRVLLQKLFEAADGNLTTTKSPCEKLNAANVWDATEPLKKIVYVSDYSCTHDMRGKQIIAHEIGHNINYLFSKLAISKESLKTYMDFRGCVAGYYPKARKIKDGHFSIDTKYTEEDMADLISNIAYPDNEDLFACALLYPDIAANGYKNLNLRPANAIDPHSEALYRVLMEAITKGKSVPHSCQEPMKEVASHLEFNKCSK